MSRGDVPDDVAAIRGELEAFLNKKDTDGRIVGNSKYGVYAFYDYDGEPIYVGQTVEKLRVRIRRHLTNQRTDAVAMKVLDPFEVAEIEMWPFFDLASDDVRATLDAAGWVLAASIAVLMPAVCACVWASNTVANWRTVRRYQRDIRETLRVRTGRARL